MSDSTNRQANRHKKPNSQRKKAEPILRRRFWRLALFNIGSNLTVPLTGLVDTAMLGWLPDIRFLAGVALASLIFDYLYFGLGFLRMSTTGHTAQAEGRGEDSSAVLWRSLTLAAMLAAIILLSQTLIEHLAFLVLSGEHVVETVGREYFRARIWGAPGAILQLALVGWLLGRERSGSVLVVMSVANLTNVALNWYFIIQLDLAARGAGWASAIAQTLGAATAGLIVLRQLRAMHQAQPHPNPAGFRASLNWEAMRSLLQLNSQIFVRTLLLVTCFALFTDASARLGTVVLAANAILLRWVNLIAYLVDGVAYATETLAGRLWGARTKAKGNRQLREFLHYALVIGSILSAVVWLPMVLLPGPIIRVFTVDPSTLAYATSMSAWLAPIGIFGALAYVLDGFYLGLTRGRDLLQSMFVAAGGTLFLIVIAVKNGNHWLLWLSLVALMGLRTLTLGLGANALLARFDSHEASL